MMTSLLSGVNPHDPAVFMATAGVLACVATLASIMPARRAAHLDPTKALRVE